jgi:hypothetical protein
MSTLVVPLVGLKASLQDTVRGLVGATAHLFVAPWVPGNADTLLTYTTIEASFPGYIPLLIVGWGEIGQDGNTPPGAVVAAKPVTWRRTVTGVVQNVYGVFVVDEGGVLRFAQADDNAPQPVANAGDQYTYSPQLDRKSQ